MCTFQCVNLEAVCVTYRLSHQPPKNRVHLLNVSCGEIIEVAVSDVELAVPGSLNDTDLNRGGDGYDKSMALLSVSGSQTGKMTCS